MDISKYIYDYLMEYNMPVVVPDLGCFTIVNIPSEIMDGTVIPPFRTVKLDSENTYDDGVLKSYIARKASITIEQAAEWLRNFYNHNFLKKLPIVKTIVFEKFGTFSLSEYNNIVFVPDPDFFKDSYGLGNAYFYGNTQQIPTVDTVAPEPPMFVPVPEPPVFNPVPEPPIFNPVPEPPIFVPVPEPPMFVPEPEPVFVPEPEPLFAPKYEPVQTPPDPPQPKPEDSLFDMNDTSRFRENPTRTKRSTMFEKKEPTERPKTKIKPPPVQKKPKQKTNTGSSNLWVLWVLIAAAGLGVGGYYFYPKIYPMFVSRNTTITMLEDLGNDTIPVDTKEPDEENSNAAPTQTLDDATDKKVALNPETSQRSDTSTPQTQSQPQSQSTPAVVPSTAPATGQRQANVTQPQANVGQGSFVVIVASFRSNSEADRFGRRLQQQEGVSYEIIPATVNGVLWNRVSVGGYNSLAEATQQANQLKSRPAFRDAWVTKR